MQNKTRSNKAFHKKEQSGSFFLQQSRTRSLKKNFNFSISQLLSASSTEIVLNHQQLQDKERLKISPIFQKPNFNQKFMMLRKRRHYLGSQTVNQEEKSKRQQLIKQKIKQRIKLQLSQMNSSILVTNTMNSNNKQDLKNSTIRISSSKILHLNPRKNKVTPKKQNQSSKVSIKGYTLPFRISQSSPLKQKTGSSAFIKKVASFSNTKCKTTSKTESIRRLQNATMLNFQKSTQINRGSKSSFGVRTETNIFKKKKSNDFAEIQPWDATQRLPSIQF